MSYHVPPDPLRVVAPGGYGYGLDMNDYATSKILIFVILLTLGVTSNIIV